MRFNECPECGATATLERTWQERLSGVGLRCRECRDREAAAKDREARRYFAELDAEEAP